jgi:hypothetical protein
MSAFLLKFDRKEQKLVGVDEFNDLAAAESARLRAELEALASDRDWEIVTLEAKSIDELRHTHASYWPDKFKVGV